MSSASSPPDVAAHHRDGRLAGQAGRSLYWQSWAPEGAPRAVVVVAHGASEHSGRYRYVVERLVPDGFAVYGLDHRGHGRSEGRRAQIDRMPYVVADFDALVELARHEHPGTKIFLLGHSMGGCVALSYALVHQAKLAGLALSAPVAALEIASPLLRVVARALSVVAPGFGVYEVEAAAVSRDPGEVRAYDEDPLVHRGKLPARTVQELVDAVGAFPARVPELTLPLLVMIGTADGIVAPAGGRMVHDRAASADRTLQIYDGFFHELFNEPAGERDRPLGDLAGWLAQRS